MSSVKKGQSKTGQPHLISLSAELLVKNYGNFQTSSACIHFLWTKKWLHWTIFQGQREPLNAELMPDCSVVVKETPHFLRVRPFFSFMAWLRQSDLTCFSSALAPAERLGHFCLSVSIYNTETRWINNPAVPDLSCFSTVAALNHACLSLSLSLSECICLSVHYAPFSVHF